LTKDIYRPRSYQLISWRVESGEWCCRYLVVHGVLGVLWWVKLQIPNGEWIRATSYWVEKTSIIGREIDAYHWFVVLYMPLLERLTFLLCIKNLCMQRRLCGSCFCACTKNLYAWSCVCTYGWCVPFGTWKKKYFKVCVQTRVGKKQDTGLVGLFLLKNGQNSF